MPELFDGKVLVLGKADITRRSYDENKSIEDICCTDIKFSMIPFMKADFVLYYDEDTHEMKVLKSRKDIINGTL